MNLRRHRPRRHLRRRSLILQLSAIQSIGGHARGLKKGIAILKKRIRFHALVGLVYLVTSNDLDACQQKLRPK